MDIPMKGAWVQDASRTASHPRHSIQSMAWMAWIAAIVVIATLTRNPWYLGTMIAIAAFVRRRCASPSGLSHATMLSPVRFSLLVMTTAALLNMAMVHVGVTVLFTLPAWIPLLGGAWTLEALVYGALNGAALVGLFLGFSVLNCVTSTRSLLRLIPRAFYPVAVVTSIAVSFIPTTLQQIEQIREAQAVRGHRLRGVRSWLPLMIPLLEGSMERALQLAEAMTARGFAGSVEPRDRWPQVLTLTGFGSLVAGWLLQMVWRQQGMGAALLALGALLMLTGLRRAGRRHPHTVYRPERWRTHDWVVASAAGLTLLAYSLPLFERATLFYYPYPMLTWPAFDWRIGLATLGLLAPALVETERQ
ncbi:MAG: energy-coupling factor transporter transmembrane protein EcfT [Caldilinea sp.]|nr:energy-coupling factor transporter transmembrane protein EcfT [Caldilinea sp.]MDW8440583.1 energy-coupling factor transporter transmembrane component T [Caldilineaceae bacterium]